MNPKIIELDAFYLNGIRKEFTSETMGDIALLWQQYEQDGTLNQLAQHNNVPSLEGYIGACLKQQPMPHLNYLISVASTTPLEGEGIDSVLIPASEWAVFEAIGPIPRAIQDTFEFIYGTWFKDAPYTPRITADLEFYPKNDDYEGSEPRTEIWVPLERV